MTESLYQVQADDKTEDQLTVIKNIFWGAFQDFWVLVLNNTMSRTNGKKMKEIRNNFNNLDTSYVFCDAFSNFLS